jgi:hypothetical protein
MKISIQPGCAALALGLALGTPAAFAQISPSDPLQKDANAPTQDDTASSKNKVKAKKKAPASATNKPEPYVLDGKTTSGTTGSPRAATSPDNTQGPNSMTAPQPGRGGPLPPGVTDPPAPSNPATPATK